MGGRVGEAPVWAPPLLRPRLRVGALRGWVVLTVPLPRLEDLGLEQFSVSELFSSIFIPGFFLLACILQLHYFHRPFMQLTDLERISLPAARRPRWVHRCARPCL